MSAMAKAQKGKAVAFISEAEGLLAKKSWFSSSKERNQEDAAEIYEKAANAYKVGGFNQEAGDSYSKAAEIYRDKLSNFNEASKCLNNAGKWMNIVEIFRGSLFLHLTFFLAIILGGCYKKSSPADSIAAYKAAVMLYVDNGRITQAAKLAKQVAELYETEQMDEDGKSSVVLAIENYEQASELFGMEDSKSSASQCLAKIAELCSAALDPPDFLRASQIYDDLGRRCLDSNLLKYNAKGYFLQAILCHLASGDAIGAQQATQKYEGLDYTFGESREGKFGSQLIECVEGFDAEGFATACFEFDRISKLDPWKTSILVRVKRSIDDGCDDDDDSDDDVDLT
jgi:alpha-soluble NSF attachment protein